MAEHDRCLCMAGTDRVLAAGDRRVVLSPLAINWGDSDERADWQAAKAFCSFACLREWADTMSAIHDVRAA